MKRNKIILTVLILSMIALIFSGCGGGGNLVTPQPDNPDDSDLILISINDPESDLIGIVGNDAGEGLGVYRDNTVLYISGQGDALKMILGEDGLPFQLIDYAENHTIVFKNYTDSTVDISVYNSVGNLIEGPVIVETDLKELTEIRGVQKCIYFLERDLHDVADFLKEASDKIQTAACLAYSSISYYPGAALACGSMVIDDYLESTPDTFDNEIVGAISVAVPTDVIDPVGAIAGYANLLGLFLEDAADWVDLINSELPIIDNLIADPNPVEPGEITNITCYTSNKEYEQKYIWYAPGIENFTEGVSEESIAIQSELLDLLFPESTDRVVTNTRSIHWTAPDNEGVYTIMCMVSNGNKHAGKSIDITGVSINGDITDVSPLTNLFTLDEWYTSYVYVKNTGSVAHTFTVRGVETVGSSALYFKEKEKSIFLEAGESDYLSFEYMCYGDSTDDRILIFRLYENADDESLDYIDQMTKTIYFEDDNHAPVITSTAVTSATKDEPYSYNVNAIDSDGDALTYSLTTKPSGMTINDSTGLISWTPTTIGSFGVTIKVSDGELSATQSFTITVSESPPTKTLISLTVDPDTMSFSAAGQTKYISEIILGWSDGSTSYLAKGDATYYVYNTSVAKVVMSIPNVKVQSVGEGSTNIKVSYTDNGIPKYDYIAVTVGGTPTKTLTSLTVSPDTMSFSTAGQDKYISKITLGWSDGSTGYLAQGDATYSGYNTAVAKVFMTIPNVKVQSVGEGSTNIKVSYTDNGVTKYDYIAVSVEYAPAELQYIEAYPKNMAFDLNDANKCDDVTQVVAWYSDGSWENIDINSVSYLSNNTGVATVNSSGTVCGVGEGNTTIKVTYQGEYDTISVSVSDSGIKPPSVSTSEDYFYKVDPNGDAYIGVPGKIQATGGENAYERGFEYQDLAGGSVKIKNYYGDYGTGSWYRPLYIGSEIYSGHSYKYRAYAVNSAGTGYGVWRTFTVD